MPARVYAQPSLRYRLPERDAWGNPIATYPPEQLRLLANEFVWGCIFDDYTQEHQAKWLYSQHNFDYTPEFDRYIEDVADKIRAVLLADNNRFVEELNAGRIESNNL